MSDVSRSQCSHLHTALPLAVGREEPLYTTHCSSLSTLFVNYIVKFIILSFLIFIYSLNKPSMTAKSTLLIKTMQAGSRLITIFPNVTITFQNVTTAQSRSRVQSLQLDESMLFCIRGVALLAVAVSTIIAGQNLAEGATNTSAYLSFIFMVIFTHFQLEISIMYSFFDKNELFHASTVCRCHHKYTRELPYTISWQRSSYATAGSEAVTLLLFCIKSK